MEGALAIESGSLPTILCCMCGVEITQNPANMCVSCLRSNVDITEGINKAVALHSCRSCGRFLCPPWQQLALESKELLTVCLRKIAGLSTVKLIDAAWVWTEPHSMRLKLKLTVQKEVINGAILQQAVVVDFIVRNQQCKSCEASFAQGAWHAVVQVRQRVSHKRTFFFLEQLLLKHEAHSECIRIVTFCDGMDFYFTEKNQALRFIDFLEGNAPLKMKYSRKLVSADHSSNTADFKHNYLVEIAPICKDDLIVLPKDLATNLSNMSRLVLAKRIAQGIHIIDPFTGERHEVNTEKYWRYEFKAAMDSKQLVKYVVLSVEPVLATLRPSAKTRGNSSKKIRLAEVVVARERDFGVVDTQFSCRTHLGNLLREGDVVLGYDLTVANWTTSLEDMGDLKLTCGALPDLVLVRKYYGNRGDRKWALRQLEVNEREETNRKGQEDEEADYEEFMQEVEADKEFRTNIKLYKKEGAVKKQAARMQTDDAAASDEDEQDDEEVRLEELLDDMELTGDTKDDVGAEAVIVSKEEADRVAAFPLGQPKAEFGTTFNPKDFKFV